MLILNFVDSLKYHSMLTSLSFSFLYFVKVIESTWTPNNFSSLYPGQQADMTEVKCLLPKSPVNIGDYGSEGVTAAGLKIKVSNNGVNASAAHMLFISYDSVCQECNTITGCRLKVNG